MSKFQIETKTYGNCYFADGACVWASANKMCTNENAQNCRHRQKNNEPDPNAHKKCYYPAECSRETPAGYCSASSKTKCSYRGNNPLATPEEN